MAITVSVLQGGANNHETTSEEVNFLGTDFVPEGVVGAITNTSGVAPATGAFAVNAQGSPDMTVAVSAGVAYVQATPTSGNSQLLRVKNSASSNVTISANATGGTRYDWLYIKIDPDKAKDPDSGADDVATLVTSRSTSSASDNGTPPTYGYPLAVITVANGASSITNGNIADARVRTGPTPGDDGVTAPMIVGLDKSNLTTDYNPYKFHAHAATNQTISDNTSTKITLGTEDFDTNGNFASNTYTAPVAGFYHINAQISFSTTKGASYKLDLKKNGSILATTAVVPFPAASTFGDVSLVYADVIQLAANDTIDIYGTVDSSDSSSVTVLGDTTKYLTYLSGHLVSRT